MGGAGRFGGLLLAVATLGSTLAGCSNEDPRAANPTTTVADDNSPPSEVTIAVTVDSGGSASAPTRIRVGRREPVTLEGGRVDATVIADGADVGKVLIEEGLARPYSGGKRRGWC